jgi:hypothetical protein
VLANLRFSLYRNVVAFFSYMGFKSQKVTLVEVPTAGQLTSEPFGKAHPTMPIKGIYQATSFPPEDKAEERLKRIKGQTKLLGLLKKVAPEQTAPIPGDLAGYLAAVYPKSFRKAWPAAPAVPAELVATKDLIASLAVQGPFASYLRQVDDHYEIDLDWMSGYAVAPGLIRPGGKAVFDVEDGALVTREVRNDAVVPERARMAFLAALNEDLTTFRHNVDIHLTVLTAFALASGNQLDPKHPVRRLIHHCFHTVLIGNVELGTAQLGDTNGFSATIFSHPADVLRRMIEDHLAHLDFADYDPHTQFANRGTTETAFAYPYRENVMELWAATKEYVESYLALYFDGDDAVAKDSALASWASEADRLIPNGIAIPIGGITRDWLARTCATLIHVSTVEHDILNNVVWNYSTLGWLIPTVAPASGELMDRRRAFDLLATLIGTWKPYNMVLTAGIPSLALDDEARAVMQAWIDRLDRIQDAMAARGKDLSVSYPANLNVSISN